MKTVPTIASVLLLVAAGCATTGQRQPAQNDAAKRVVTMQAQPRLFEMDLQKTAVIVVDMQNDFGSKGGLLDRLGMSIAEIRAVIPPTARALAAARSVGIPIVYLKMAYRPDLSDLGASDAPNRIGHLLAGVGKTVAAPNGVPSRILIRDTSNTEILDELFGSVSSSDEFIRALK